MNSDFQLIYIDSGYFDPCEWSLITGEKKDRFIGLRFPQIWTSGAENFFFRHREDILKSSFDAFLVRNPESVFYLTELYGKAADELPLVFDYTFNIFNKRAALMLMSMFNLRHIRLTPSPELKAQEISRLFSEPEIPADMELLVYGRIPMMATAQCPASVYGGCKREMKTVGLKDRKGVVFQVKNCCPFCISTVYNSLPTVLFDLARDIKKLNPASLRFDFSTEHAADIRMLTDRNVPARYTRGRFRSGII